MSAPNTVIERAEQMPMNVLKERATTWASLLFAGAVLHTALIVFA